NAGTAPCNSNQTCYQDSDCSGTLAGRCATIPGKAAKSCTCNGGTATCPGGYTCTGGRCLYNKGCKTQPSSGANNTIVVDPAAAGFSSTQVLPWVDGIEDYHANASGKPTNPELRAVGSTPLSAAARAATSWYQSNIAADTQSQCRPYVLVQVTDGADTCDADT